MTQPPAFSPPPPGPPPPQSAPPRKRRRWLLVGVVALVAVVAGIGATFYATGFFDGADGSRPSDTAGSVSPSVKQLSSPEAPDDPPKYRHNGHACADVDWGPLAKVTELAAEDVEEDYQPTLGSATTSCKVASKEDQTGYDFELTIFDSAEAAAEEFEAAELDGSDAAEGPWEQGSWRSGADKESAYAYLRAQDSNVYLSFHAGKAGGDSEADIKSAVTEVVASVFAAVEVKTDR